MARIRRAAISARAADEVDDLAAVRIAEHAVDGEVAAARILRRRRRLHAHRMAPVAVLGVGAEARHLDRMAIAEDQHDAELRADRHGAGKQLLHCVDVGVSGDVEIGRLLAAQPIAHAAAGEVSAEAVVAQAAQDGAGRMLGRRLARIARRGGELGRLVHCTWDPESMIHDASRRTEPGQLSSHSRSCTGWFSSTTGGLRKWSAA